MGIHSLQGLPPINIVPNSLLDKALAEKAKRDEEKKLKQTNLVLDNLAAHTTALINERRRNRRELNKTQRRLKDLAKRVAWLNEKNDVLPLMVVTQPVVFACQCGDQGKDHLAETHRIQKELDAWTPTQEVTLPTEDTSEDDVGEVDNGDVGRKPRCRDCCH